MFFMLVAKQPELNKLTRTNSILRSS